MNKKKALIFGGTSGIGKAIFDKFVTNGIESIAISAHSKPQFVNVCNSEEVNCFVNNHKDANICVYSVGVPMSGMFEALTVHHLQNGLDLYVKGLFNVCKAIIPGMKKLGGGKIIVIGALRASIVSQNKSVYCISKAAAGAMMRAVQEEVRDNNIQVTIVHPGFTNTWFHKEKSKRPYEIDGVELREVKITQPEDIAEIVYMLVNLSPGAEVLEIKVGRAFDFNKKDIRLFPCLQTEK